MRNKKIVLLIVLLLVCVLSLTACGEASLADLQEEATASLDSALANYTESDYSADNYATITTAYDTALAGINAVTDTDNLPGGFVSTFVSTADEVVTIAEQTELDTAAALAAAKTSAIASLDAELAKYDSSDYSIDNYATITTAYTTAKSGIEAVTDVANLPGEFVSAFATAADEVVTIAEQAELDTAALVAAKTSAIEALDTELANYASTDYTSDNYATITTAYTTAKSGINGVTDIANLPGEFVSAFATAADKVVTIAQQEAADAAALAAAKTSTIADLDTALATYTESDYTTATYAVITNAYNTVLANINAVTDVANLPGGFVDSFESVADKVVTIAEQAAADAEALAAKIATELALLETSLKGYVEADYTTDNYATITSAYTTAKTGIEAVTDIADLPGTFVSTFTTAADVVVTIAEQAAADAEALAARKVQVIALLDTALATYTEGDYTEANYESIEALYDTALAGINGVELIENLPGDFVSTFTTAADEVVTVAQTLAATKTSAIESLDTELAKYASTDYTTDNYATITTAYDTALAGINAVTDVANLPGSFVATFVSTADKVATIAATLSAAKTTELAALATALEAYIESSYTEANYDAIEALYNTAKASIEAVTDVANLPGEFVATFMSAADKVDTIAATLSAAKTTELAALEAELAKYVSTAYTTTNYATITSAYNTAKDGINAVTDVANLPGEFVSAFTTAAEAVVTIAQQVAADAAALAEAKEDAIDALDTAFAEYTESDYSEDNYAAIKDLYDTALAGINGVTDIANLPGDFVSGFVDTADRVVTIAEQAAADAEALASKIAAELALLATALESYDSDDYTADNYATITSAYTTAKSGIEGVTDINNLPGSFLSTFVSTAKAVDTIAATLSAAKTSATKSLDEEYAKYAVSDYTTANYATITSAYNTAKDGINAVTDVEDLPGSFVATFVSVADKVVTIAATLSAAKTTELAVLDTALANYDSADYTTDNYATITSAYDTALASINAVTDVANLPGEFVATFMSAADKVVTIAATLSAAKTTELAVLDTALANYDSADYTTGNYATITSAYDTAKASIEAVTDIANLPGAFVSTFTTAAEAVVTIAQQAAADLAAEKLELIADLDTALATYTEGDYSATNYALITSAYATAVAGINAVTEIADLPGSFITTFTATAEAVDDIYVGFSFTENTDGTYSVSSYTGTATDVVVPSTYEGGAVTGIVSVDNKVNGAFYNNSTMQTLVLPDSITSIGAYAFHSCKSMISITLPNTITVIGIWAFSTCSDLTDVYYGGDVVDWCSINFSSSSSANPMYSASNFYTLTSGDYGTNNAVYTELTTIDLSNSDIITISEYAFYSFENITTVILPDSLTTIEKSAFHYCYALDTIYIPKAVTEIESYAFYQNGELSNVYYGGSSINDWLAIDFGASSANPCNYSSDSHFYLLSSGTYGEEDAEYTEVTSLELDLGSATTSNYGLYGFNNLTSVVIAGGTAIPGYMFCNCTGLESITLSNSITDIGTFAFGNCTSITEVYYGGTAIDWFKLPITSASHSPLYASTYTSGNAITLYLYDSEEGEYYAPTTIDLSGSEITSISAYSFMGISNVTTFIMPDTVTTIGTYAFFGSAIQSITLSEEITTINSYTFRYCTSLTSVVIPSSVTTISSYAFQYCSSLTSVIIPSAVTTIATNAFSYCTSLESVTVTVGKLTTINSAAFTGCDQLVINVIGAYVPQGWSIDGIPVVYTEVLVTSGDYVYKATSNSTATLVTYLGSSSVVVVPSEIDGYTVTIVDGAFYKNTTITSVTLPEGIVEIGTSTFERCTNLATVVLPDGLTIIGDSAFLLCPALYEIIIPDTVESIGTSLVTNYRVASNDRTGTTFVVSCAETLLLMLNNSAFIGSTLENIIQLGDDIYFESGMDSAFTSSTSTNFDGTIDGSEAMYSLNNLDLLSHSCLIYYAGTSTFTNITINVGQNGGALVIYAYGDSITFDNIETYGDVYLAGGTANYSPIMAISVSATVCFIDVTTYANITALGSSYFSNFLGGYSNKTVTFENCINHGNLIGDNPSVFIGNSFGMSNVSIVIAETVYNRGNVVGYTNSAYFGAVGDAGDSYHAEQVAAIESNSLNIAPVVSDGSITVTTGEDGTISISDSGEDATQYLVTYTAWATLTGTITGTRCISISYLVSAADMASTGLPTTVLMTTTLHEGITFVADNTSSATASAMMYLYEGVWYLYVDTSELTGAAADCLLVDRSTTATVMGLDDNLNVVTVQI